LNCLIRLMRRVKIRAAKEDRKLKDLIAELLEAGLTVPSPAPAGDINNELPCDIDPETGFPVARTMSTPGFIPPTSKESLILIERANEEEDLRHAGLSR